MLKKELLEKMDDDSLVEYATDLGLAVKEKEEKVDVVDRILSKQEEIQIENKRNANEVESLEETVRDLKENSGDDDLKDKIAQLELDKEDLSKKVLKGQEAIQDLSKVKGLNGQIRIVHISKGTTDLRKKFGKWKPNQTRIMDLKLGKEIAMKFPARFRLQEIKETEKV